MKPLRTNSVRILTVVFARMLQMTQPSLSGRVETKYERAESSRVDLRTFLWHPFPAELAMHVQVDSK